MSTWRVNNFNQVEKLLEFKEGCYYKFNVMTRAADGEKPSLKRSFFVENQKEFDELKDKMQEEAKKYNARVYLVLNRQSLFNSYLNMVSELTNQLKTNQLSTKALKKTLESVSQTSRDKESKKYVLFDVDTKDLNVLKEVENALSEFYVDTFESVKGYHVLALAKFDTRKYQFENVDVKKDAMVLVYA